MSGQNIEITYNDVFNNKNDHYCLKLFKKIDTSGHTEVNIEELYDDFNKDFKEYKGIHVVKKDITLNPLN